MQFVYHIKPPNIIGNELIPLNQLRQSNLNIYLDAAKKYEGRTNLMQVKLPILNCFWNDVVHLSPIHPGKIRAAINLFMKNPLPERQCYKIPIAALRDLPSITFQDQPRPPGVDFHFNDECFSVLDIAQYKEMIDIPKWTIDYFGEEIARGRSPLWFNGILHVLALGKVPLHSSKIENC